MEENYIWKLGGHAITVVAPGLYRLEVGLYADNEIDKIEAFVCLNGSPICYLKNK